MNIAREPEYLLTIVQHTYCGDCMWVKGKITDVYHASGIVRGEDSKRWRMQILSPPWDREARRAEFPSHFETVDVPAMKLEADRRLIFATQNPALISDILVHLKWLLINRKSNAEIEREMLSFIKEWKEKPGADVCATSR
ncbi:MAG TPA: hypothetical protein VNN73_14680 [Blastocatellia bacterium]|nr:hypothetical protein [Blastocatellia bacterium]